MSLISETFHSEKLCCDREEKNANDNFAVKLVEMMEIKNTCPSNSAKYLNFS
jgi:hypothetical protein